MSANELKSRIGRRPNVDDAMTSSEVDHQSKVAAARHAVDDAKRRVREVEIVATKPGANPRLLDLWGHWKDVQYDAEQELAALEAISR